MLETGIGRAHNVAMASLPNFLLPGDISASDRYYAEDIVDPPFRLQDDGRLAVPKGAGIGVGVGMDRLEAVTRRVTSYPPGRRIAPPH
jgi:O-succinylbenzoate synthase